MLEGQSWGAAALIATACWLLFASPWLFGGQVIPWDAKDFYYPALRALARALHAGEDGLWNPWLRSGMATVDDPQSWLFTPTFRLLATFVAEPSMRMVDALQLLHLLAGGLGLLILGRLLGWRPFAALLAALVFMFGGAAAARLQHTIMTVSYAFLPWALVALRVAIGGKRTLSRFAAGIGFGLAVGVMAVDRDQVAFVNGLFLVVAVAWWLGEATLRQGIASLPRRLLELAPGAGAAVAVIAVPAILTLTTLPESTRAALNYAGTITASLQPASLLTIFAPNLFGNLEMSQYWGPGTDPWYGFASADGIVNDPTTTYLYVGVLPLALLLVVLALPGLRRRVAAMPEAWLFTVGLVLATLYAVGSYTPVFRVLYDLVPGVALYRRPNDAVFLMNAALSLVVGAAAAGFLRAPPGERVVTWRAVAILGGAMLAAWACAAWLGFAVDHPLDGVPALAAATALVLAGILIWVRGPAPAGAGVWGLAVIGLLAVDLIAHNSGSDLNARPEATIAAYRPEASALAADIKRLLDENGGRYRAEIYGVRTPGDDGGGSWQNAAVSYGIEQTLGYDPLLSAEYARAVGADQNSHLHFRRLTPLFTGYDSPIARLLGIRVVVTGQPIDKTCPPSARAGLKLIAKRAGAYVYLNPAALPRVMVVGRAEVDRGGALPTDPRRTVLIADLAANDPIDPADRAPGTAEITHYGGDEISITARMARPGWLVLNDRFHRGWRAEIDGAEVPIRRANRLFRALRVPAGEHKVVFAFDPLAPSELFDLAVARLIP